VTESDRLIIRRLCRKNM